MVVRRTPCMVSGKFDVLFAIDGSKYVDDVTFKKIKDFIKNALLSYKISEHDARIGIVSIGGSTISYLQIGDGTSLDTVLKAITNLKNGGGSRNIARGLEFITEKMLTEKSKRVGSKQNLVFITTGSDESNDDSSIMKNVNQLKDRGVKIITIGIGGNLGNAVNISSKQNMIYVNGGIRVLPEYLGTVESHIGIRQGKYTLLISLTRFILV